MRFFNLPKRQIELRLLSTVNSEKIALVYFLRFLRLASDAKWKFDMISAATLSV